VNRCSQVIADKCTALIANHISQSQPFTLDRLSFGASLKYLVLHDPSITIEITSPTSFDIYESQHGLVVANGPALSQARLADFFLGSTRVRKQYDAVLKLRDSGAPTAWLLISAYYCAFFACIEICKLLNRVSFGLEEDDIATLQIKSIGPSHAQFFAAAPNNFVGVEYAGKLQFRSSGAKPHSAAWESALLALRSLYAPKGWSDANLLLEILSNPDYSPSRIRNAWNYKRTDYFGTLGETKGAEFKKLIGNSNSVAGWLTRNRGRLDVQEPCIIAVLCELLSTAVTDAARRGGELLRNANA
jgi:hypothetical protein